MFLPVEDTTMEYVGAWALGLVIPLVVLIALGGFIVTIYVVLLEVRAYLLRSWQRFRRRPQFGLVGLSTLTAVFALASALLSHFELRAGPWFLVLALFAMIWAAGLFCAAYFIITDLAAALLPRRKGRDNEKSEACEPFSAHELQQLILDFPPLSQAGPANQIARVISTAPPEIAVRH
jgi:hypothetical protein